MAQSNKMNKTQLLKSVLKGAEVTTVGKEAYLNKYRYDHKKIDLSFVNILIFTKIIGVESGNFETGERHYRLEDFFYTVKNKIKTIHLKKIGECIESHKKMNFGVYKSFDELIQAYETIKIQSIRKQKLEKITLSNKNLYT